MPTVFISYSHQNLSVVQRLKKDLRDKGLTIWVDHESLKPGTRSWETAIREGIQASDIVLYLASPMALNSVNVQGELDVATHYKKQIVPLWVEGNEWLLAVPMAMTKMQYIDMRENYSSAFR